MFDAHTHLNQEDLYNNRQEYLQNFINIGGTGLINIGVNHEYNTKGIQICKDLHENDTTPTIGNTDKSGRYAKLSYIKSLIEKPRYIGKTQVYCTIGLHPCEVISNNITDINMRHKIKEMCMLYTPYKEYIVGIGECGIDTFQEGSQDTLEIQKDLFTQQCDLARQRGLPIVIHSRANWESTHDVLKEFSDLRIYFHCRSYTPEEIKIIKKTYSDFYIGFTGNITYPKAVDIRKSLRYLINENENYPEHIISGKLENIPTKFHSDFTNLTNLLIETDAPYLPPQSHRGEQNQPAFIKETYYYISQLLGYNITDQVIENTKKCYKI